MRAVMLIFCGLVLLLAGCLDNRGQDTSKSMDYTLPPISPWLDPSVQISSAVRLITKSGYDLRRAMLAPADDPNDRQALLLLRDYTQRQDGVPDPHVVLLLDLDSEKLIKVQDLPGEVITLHPAVEDAGWLASSLVTEEDAAWDEGTLAVSSIAPDATVVTWNTEARLWPLGVLQGQGIAAMPIDRLAVSGGLVSPGLNWKEPLQRLDPVKQVAKQQAGPWMMVGNAGLAAGLTLDYDPALPTQARMTYLVAPGADTRKQRQWHFGYYAGGGQAGWLPPLAEVDGSALAAIVFQGDSTGKGKTGGAQGIFRLLTLNAKTGQTGMIEDHLPADLPVVADHGVVFYTRQAWTGAAMRWEAWASSSDGLRKHLLYSTPDAIYLAVEDAAGGRRVLLHRQYLEVKEGTPELHCELRELSLDPLIDQGAKADVEALNRTGKVETKDGAQPVSSDELFTLPGKGNAHQMPPGGSSPPPIAVPK